ncbi:RND family efflux transporter MFP subunit [Dysgonomonas alginatilytica]|uniref:RND family efflux transporter MFP subunit n=1 Tax=Dysgonomonas alginatilytica TaxID=1605892 RepID=A0A2V3PQ15_9BACT|nr:efflux RND transporter periplasmic adaptor subunit [Dysgonomonas alginatilytica]PXV58874.1 RND family efflux transporter MFP subunit [Dysgonomonas alginatilytica]
MDIEIKKKHPVLKYKYYILAGTVIFFLVLYVFFSSLGATKLRYEKDNAQIAEIAEGKFLEYLDIEGIAQPKLTVKLNSSENGTVERIVAQEGSMLNKGDTILILSNPELVRTIQDERDDLEKQQISYKDKMLQMKQKSSELKRTTLKTVYELDRQSKQYSLDKEEYQIGIKSKAQLEVSSDDYNFNQKNTKLLLEELKNDSLMNLIQQDLMNNDLKREEKKYTNSRDRLDNLIVKAPVSGQLSFVSVIPGERVIAGNNIGEQKIIDDLKISTKVNEYYIDRIAVGLPASVIYQGKQYILKITKINPEIRDRLFEIDLVFVDEKPDNIRIGKSFRIQIELGQPEKALVVDKGNFYQNTGGQWVFKLNEQGNKAIKTNIVIGRQNPKQYEILDGLKTGDRIIISGYDNFGDAQELILK